MNRSDQEPGQASASDDLRSNGGDAGALTFAVVSGSPATERSLADLCQVLADALARPVAPLVLPSYAALKSALDQGLAQVVWAPPLVAIELEDEGLATIALCCARGGRIDYHAALFTRHAAPYEKLGDLQGCHAAWVDAHSAAGYLLPRMHLVSEGYDPAKLFGKESFLGTHAAVACAVLDGEVDVGATYLSLDPRTGRPESAGWLEAGAGINGAFILATAGPIPSDAIALSNRLSAEEKAALVTALLALPAAIPETVGHLLRADGFAVPGAAHFAALRALKASAPRG
ncbi:MAG: PhnD/SsuA/transferrin family substrate-binding protein [Minicystis sp.]